MFPVSSPATLLSLASHPSLATQAVPVPPVPYSSLLPGLPFLPFLCLEYPYLIPKDLTEMPGETFLGSF